MAVVYQKDKNAIKFVTDFYKKFKPNHRLTQVEIDSIFAQYDGDYETMVKDIYGALTKYTPSDSDITSVVNRYALKKKRFGKWFIRIGNWRIGAIRNKRK